MAKRVCRWCKKKGESDFMVFEEVGKTKKYYCKSCYENDYLPDKKYKEEQKQKKEKLYEKVAEIYEIPLTEIPKSYFVFVENLRNGEAVFNGQKRSEKYKQGYDYDIIEKAYDYCRKDIEYWNGAKDFDSISIALRYGLRIIIDKINYVERLEKRYKAEETVSSAKVEGYIEKFDSTYTKNKKHEKDISDFLDD